MKYYNFTGLSDGNTIGTVVARKDQNTSYLHLDVKLDRGDETVPAVSGSRTSARGSYLGNHVVARSFDGVTHSDLPNNLDVYDAIKCILENSNPSTCLPAQRKNVGQSDPIYQLKIVGSPSVRISDSYGNTADPLSTSFGETVDTITCYPTGNSSLTSRIPLDQADLLP